MENNDNNTYSVAITETLRRVVDITATDEVSAEQQVIDGWMNSDYVLCAEDFSDVDFCVLDADAQSC